MEKLKLYKIEKNNINEPDIFDQTVFQGMTFALIRANSRSMLETLSSMWDLKLFRLKRISDVISTRA
jgi:hypothetical protein